MDKARAGELLSGSLYAIGFYINHTSSFVEEMLIAPACKSVITSSFSDTKPPAITGTDDSLHTLETIFGISAGSTSITSGFAMILSAVLAAVVAAILFPAPSQNQTEQEASAV